MSLVGRRGNDAAGRFGCGLSSEAQGRRGRPVAYAGEMMPFKFSERSLSRLEDIHPDLLGVAHRAIAISEVDFAITEGKRSQDRQAELVKAGASRTMNGRHVTGHAIDVVAVSFGTLRWEWVWYPKIAHAFQQAGIGLHVPLVWGGCWDRTLNEIGYDLELAAAQYQERFRRVEGRRALVDGPHFELQRRTYPAEIPHVVTA